MPALPIVARKGKGVEGMAICKNCGLESEWQGLDHSHLGSCVEALRAEITRLRTPMECGHPGADWVEAEGVKGFCNTCEQIGWSHTALGEVLTAVKEHAEERSWSHADYLVFARDLLRENGFED